MPKGKLTMSSNQNHRASNFPPPLFCRFVEDEDLSVAGDRPSPCFYSRISDEDLSAAGMAGVPACAYSRVDSDDIGTSDEDLSAGSVARPPVGYCFASDEDFSAAEAAAPMPCAFSRVDSSDEDLSVAGMVKPTYPCVTTYRTDSDDDRISDEDLSAAGLSAAGMAKCRPLGCVIGDEDLSAASMVRPTPSCSCFVSDSDEELLAASGQSH